MRNWISIKDGLPTDLPEHICDCDYMLVYGNPGPGPLFGIARYVDGNWEFMDNLNIGVHSCTGEYGFYSKDITHWCRLIGPE